MIQFGNTVDQPKLDSTQDTNKSKSFARLSDVYIAGSHGDAPLT